MSQTAALFWLTSKGDKNPTSRIVLKLESFASNQLCLQWSHVLDVKWHLSTIKNRARRKKTLKWQREENNAVQLISLWSLECNLTRPNQWKNLEGDLMNQSRPGATLDMHHRPVANHNVPCCLTQPLPKLVSCKANASSLRWKAFCAILCHPVLMELLLLQNLC